MIVATDETNVAKIIRSTSENKLGWSQVFIQVLFGKRLRCGTIYNMFELQTFIIRRFDSQLSTQYVSTVASAKTSFQSSFYNILFVSEQYDRS